MKRTSVIALALAVSVGFVAMSCGGTPPPPGEIVQEDPISNFIRETRRAAPENALLGIGTSTHSNRAMARTVAETRARAEIARQVDVVVRNMVTDYMAGSEADAQATLSFQESVTQTLAQQAQSGAIIRDEINVNNEQVTIVMLTTDALRNGLLGASQAASALAPHMGGAQWALERMDQALNAQNAQEPVLRNHD